MTTLDTPGLHQTIVMTHQQVALDLLQSVEHHTDHDQQRRTSVEVGERLLDAQELHRQRGQDRHDRQEERTRKGFLLTPPSFGHLPYCFATPRNATGHGRGGVLKYL